MIALFRVLLLLAVVAVISDMASGLRRSRTQSSYPFKEGDKVQVEYNGAWWNATVMYYADAGINISYDVGQGETIPSAQICDRVRNASENETQSSVFALGSRVEVDFERKGGYYPGSIATVHEDSTYDINYDDGDNEIGVHLDFIRVSQSHERRAKRPIDEDHATNCTASKKNATPTTRCRIRWRPFPLSKFSNQLHSPFSPFTACMSRRSSADIPLDSGQGNSIEDMAAHDDDNEGMIAHDDDHDIKVLKSRWGNLRSFNGWFPLTLDAEFWIRKSLTVNKKTWKVFGIHNALMIPLNDFERLVRKYGLWVTGRGMSWAAIFKLKLEFPSDVQIRRWGTVDKKNLIWANFYQGDEKTMLDPHKQFEDGYNGSSILDIVFQHGETSYTWENSETTANGHVPSGTTEHHAAVGSESEIGDYGMYLPDISGDSSESLLFPSPIEASESHVSMGVHRETQTEIWETEAYQNTNTTCASSSASPGQLDRNDRGTQTDVAFGLGALVTEIQKTGMELTKEQQEDAVRLVKTQQKSVRDGVNVIELHGGRKFKTVKLLVLPSRHLGAENGIKTAVRRSNVLEYVAGVYNMGPMTFQRFLRDEKWRDLVLSCKDKANLLYESDEMDIDETCAVMAAAHGGYRAMRRFRKIFRGKFSFTSEKMVRKDIQKEKDLVSTRMYRLKLGGSKGEADALVYVANLMQVVVRRFDFILKSGTYTNYFNNRTIDLSFTQDKGSQIDKWGVAIVQTTKPVAWYNVQPYAAVIPLRDDQQSKPNSNGENYRRVLPLVPWYNEVQFMSFVVIGTNTCLLPSQSIPDRDEFQYTTLKTLGALHAFKELAHTYTSYSPESATALRDAPNGSATVVIYAEAYVGMMAGGGVSVMFNAEIPISLGYKPESFGSESSITLDLLALADHFGTTNMSSVTSILCRASGSKNKLTMPKTDENSPWGYSFKEAAAGKGKPLQPRTDKSLEEDYQTFLRLRAEGKNPPHFLGVDNTSILPCPAENAMTPALHYGLGGGNFVDKRADKELSVLDQTDPRAEAEITAKKHEIGVWEEQLRDILDAVADHLNFEMTLDSTTDALVAAGMARVEQLYTTYATITEAAGFSPEVMAGLQPLVLEFNWMKESVIEIERLQKEYGTSKAQLASLEEKNANSSGVLVSYWHEIMEKEAGISRQVYWKNTLNGGAVWKLFENHKKLLEMMAKKIVEEGHPVSVGSSFMVRHASVLEPMKIACSLARAARVLSKDELITLEAACKETARAWRQSYPDAAVLTPKMLSLETDVPRIARKRRSIGLFGEDGMEALHPKWREAMEMVKCIRNPEAKATAALDKLHLQMRHAGK